MSSIRVTDKQAATYRAAHAKPLRHRVRHVTKRDDFAALVATVALAAFIFTLCFI